MIVSNLQNSARVESLHPLFKTLFDYVKENDLLHAELGRIDLDSDDLYVMNVCLDAVSADKQVLEAHRRYIDIHILLSGIERIGWKALGDISREVKTYDEKEDCALYADVPTAWVDLLPGQFMIVYPEDPHAPAVGHGKIRKLIAKIRL